ncbi:hypothetical protein TNCV_3791071 [Trichonephila clavipes]|nr:hypothetical protein TNCV_3791071 [Trichonephila clavipes]
MMSSAFSLRRTSTMNIGRGSLVENLRNCATFSTSKPCDLRSSSISAASVFTGSPLMTTFIGRSASLLYYIMLSSDILEMGDNISMIIRVAG